MPRLLVYTPTFADRLHPECERTVRAQQAAPGLTWDWVVDRDDPYEAPDHRNVLAKYQRARQKALDEGYDALLTVEHDTISSSARTSDARCPSEMLEGVAGGPAGGQDERRVATPGTWLRRGSRWRLVEPKPQPPPYARIERS